MLDIPLILSKENTPIKIHVQMKNYQSTTVNYIKQFVSMVDGLIGQWK